MEKREVFLKKWVQDKPRDVNALFNLALLKLQKEDFFSATGMLRRVLYLDPGFKEAYKALEQKPSLSFVESAKFFVFQFIPYSYLVPLNLLFLFSSFFLFFSQKRGGFFYFTSFLFLISSLFVVENVNEQFHSRATVIVKSTEARSVPSKNFGSLFSVYGGENVSILKQTEGWFQIKTNKDEVGWIERQHAFKHQI